MKEITYRCNLCRESYDREDLYQLYWTPLNQMVEWNADTEHHLCIKCVESIKKFSEKRLTSYAK